MGSVLFHVGVLAIFAGHFVGLLTPIAVFDALHVPHSAKQLLAIVAGGGAGALCLVGGAMLLHRRLFDPRIRATSSFGDSETLSKRAIHHVLEGLIAPGDRLFQERRNVRIQREGGPHLAILAR